MEELLQSNLISSTLKQPPKHSLHHRVCEGRCMLMLMLIAHRSWQRDAHRTLRDGVDLLHLLIHALLLLAWQQWR